MVLLINRLGNISPYSTGLPGASLTSTSVDPETETSRLVWDEEELMFEAISNTIKGKGKEKDVGKRRAYIRIVTSLGGSLNVELFCEKVYSISRDISCDSFPSRRRKLATIFSCSLERTNTTIVFFIVLCQGLW